MGCTHSKLCDLSVYLGLYHNDPCQLKRSPSLRISFARERNLKSMQSCTRLGVTFFKLFAKKEREVKKGIIVK